jgi:CubicO group peptidase (beta-lactamase class C family)
MNTPNKAGLSSERLARIRPAVEKYVADGRIDGVVTLIARHGEIVYSDCVGLAVRETNTPMQPDTIFRIYSMTKPITCVALMTLYERGYFQLVTPVSALIPGFRDLKVYGGQTESGPQLVDLAREVTIHDLLTHTSGLTYPWLEYGPVEEMYRASAIDVDVLLADFVEALLQLPLAFQPGTRWRYSVAYDVLAHLIEIISGQSLDAYLRENLFEPLGMVDTGFYVPEDKLDRFAALYGSGSFSDPDVTATLLYGGAMAGINKLLADPRDCLESAPHQVFRGGHGLVSTAPDYMRFCQMMLNNGELDGVRILGRKTVELMTANHLKPDLLPFEIGGIYSAGYGYGLGVDVLLDVGQCETLGSPGEYGWGGAANTNFWIDPQERLIGVLMAQYMPSGFHMITPDFRVTAYQAIVN